MLYFTEKEKRIMKEAHVNPNHFQNDSTDEQYDKAYDNLRNFCMSNFVKGRPNEQVLICEHIFDKLVEYENK